MTKLKTFFMSLFYIFLYFLITILIYGIFSKDIYGKNLILANASTILADLLILFIFIIIFRKKLIPDFNDFKINYKTYINENIKYWLLGLFLMIISNIIIGFIIGDMPTNEEVNRNVLLTLPISSIISMVITAPIIEELITRKTFKDVFKNQYIYVAISGIVFGSLHLLVAESLLEMLYVIPYAVLGCAFAKIYYETDNLWVNIFFHSLHNLIAILIIFAGV